MRRTTYTGRVWDTITNPDHTDHIADINIEVVHTVRTREVSFDEFDKHGDLSRDGEADNQPQTTDTKERCRISAPSATHGESCGLVVVFMI